MFSLLCDGNSPVTSSSLGDISRYGGPILYLFIYAFVLFGILVWVDSGSVIVRKLSQFRKQSASSARTAAGSEDEKADVKDAATDVVVAELSPHHVAFTNDQVDTAAQLVAGQDIELDPAEAARIRKKIDWHILPLMCSEHELPVF